MKAAIFTEGSLTTDDSADNFADHFEGSFLSVNTIMDEVSNYCETEVHILSEQYGYVRGSERVHKNRSVDINEEREKFVRSLLSATGDLDVILLLFTSDVFSEIVAANWNQLVERAKSGSIWCIGTSKGALNSINIETLEQDHPVLIYQRRGVARLGTETREELIDQIRSKIDD
jgi:hypothetical protein